METTYSNSHFFIYSFSNQIYLADFSVRVIMDSLNIILLKVDGSYQYPINAFWNSSRSEEVFVNKY